MRWESGELELKVDASRPARNETIRGWVPGTLSQNVIFVDNADNLIAKAHRYLKPDGTLAASGLYDPKRVLHRGGASTALSVPSVLMIKPVKREPEKRRSTSEALERFDRAMRHVITVSHDELKRRIAKAHKKASRNPHKRGPKPKLKTSARAAKSSR